MARRIQKKRTSNRGRGQGITKAHKFHTKHARRKIGKRIRSNRKAFGRKSRG